MELNLVEMGGERVAAAYEAKQASYIAYLGPQLCQYEMRLETTKGRAPTPSVPNGVSQAPDKAAAAEGSKQPHPKSLKIRARCPSTFWNAGQGYPPPSSGRPPVPSNHQQNGREVFQRASTSSSVKSSPTGARTAGTGGIGAAGCSPCMASLTFSGRANLLSDSMRALLERAPSLTACRAARLAVSGSRSS